MESATSFFNASVNGATQPITFYNSLFAPELGVNLIPVGAITAKGGGIYFSGSEVTINLNGVTVLSGKRNSDATLYRLDEMNETIKPSFQSSQALSRSNYDLNEEWHLRLVYLNYPRMIKLPKYGTVDGFIPPAGTQPPIEHWMDKAKRTPFRNSKSVGSSRVGQLIFSDIWGDEGIQATRMKEKFTDLHTSNTPTGLCSIVSVPETARRSATMVYSQRRLIALHLVTSLSIL